MIIDHAARWRERDATYKVDNHGRSLLRDVPVVDRGRAPMNPEMVLGLQVGSGSFSAHRTDADRKPPKKVVTRDILGDPKPGRTPWAAE